MPSSKISFTAYNVTCGLAKLGTMPQWRGYFSDDMTYLSRAFMRHARDTPLKHAMSWISPQLYISLTDSVFIPGMVEHFLFRKLFIEDQLVSAVANGVRQVIVLGAGLDTLTLRMAKQYTDVRFFEIDLPNTQQAKKQVLGTIEYPIPSNCIFMPADLAQQKLEAVLRGNSAFDPQLPTLAVIEGVLMYLTQSEVSALFTTMHGLFNTELTVLFGATAASDDAGNWSLRLVNALLGRGQEATKWFCPSAAMPEFMAGLGYEVKEWISYKALQRLYRAEGDIRNVPEEDENYYRVAKTS